MLRTLATHIVRTSPSLNRKTRQALTITLSLCFVVAAVFVTFGLGAGLLAVGLAGLALEGLSEVDTKENRP